MYATCEKLQKLLMLHAQLIDVSYMLSASYILMMVMLMVNVNLYSAVVAKSLMH